MQQTLAFVFAQEETEEAYALSLQLYSSRSFTIIGAPDLYGQWGSVKDASNFEDWSLTQIPQDTRILILLLSVDFFDSDVRVSLLREAINRMGEGFTLIPVLLSPVDIEAYGLQHLSYLPSNGIPVDCWRPDDLEEGEQDEREDENKEVGRYRDEAYYQIALKILSASRL